MNNSNVAYLPRIGMTAAAKLYGMTWRALRLYEERGLVRARRDRLNCRYFDGAAQRRLWWIALLRNADIALSDIHDVLQAEDRDRKGRECALEKLSARRRAAEIELTLIDVAILQLRKSPARALQLSLVGGDGSVASHENQISAPRR